MAERRKSDEQGVIMNEAREAATIAGRNIERFLEMQSKERAALLMVAHQEAALGVAKAATAASQLAAANIERFLALQRQERAALLMVAHEQAHDQGV